MSQLQLKRDTLPAHLAEYQAIKTPEDYTALVKCESPKFLPFAAKHGEDLTIGLLSSVLTDICGLMRFEVQNRMIQVAAEIIFHEFPDTKMSDLKMFRREMLAGNIRVTRFGVDTPTLVQAFREYYAAREEHFCQAREDRHKAEKQQERMELEGNDKMREVYARMRARAAQEREQAAYQAKVRSMTLEQICEAEGINYAILERSVREECAPMITPEIDAEAYVQFQLKRIELEARKSPDVLWRIGKTTDPGGHQHSTQWPGGSGQPSR